MVSKESFRQLIGFCLVGAMNNGIAFGVYLLCLYIGMHYITSNILGFLISVLNAYYWNNKYVFTKPVQSQWWKKLFKTYISYAGTGIVLSNILLVIFVEYCDISKQIAPLIILMVTVPVNFLMNKFWTFR
ncbi:MAG: GtrA family protein [Anaerovibrio sp.]|uniref:GtrA family protein n=1 Tax=Anaerovibrio sp. TaxID=1872532 RepID=UPI0025C5DAC5|nr:GtrA family protein [Anaerovibrio sp.]MBE6099373.1 GtrA family protein [Anaerovibrio sp.]